MAGVLLALVARAWTADANLRLEPIVETKQGDGVLLMPQSDWAAMARKPPVISTAFLAIAASTWPEGLIPVFAREGDSGELRRLPPRGTENSAEPLFFALPRAEETNAAFIAGTWYCTATNANGSIHHLTWQLAADGAEVGGRFDPSTEYRVAFIVGGRFESNRVRLNVEYSNDRYSLGGQMSAGVLSGTFQQEDGPEQGSWIAKRPIGRAGLPVDWHVVSLFEWTNTVTGQKRYLKAGELLTGEWRRGKHPLCRVWTRSR